MQNNIQVGSPHPLFHLKLVGKVAFFAGILSFAALFGVLVFVSDNSGDAYWQVVKAHSITHHALGPSMLLAGFFLVGATGVISWLVSLYASFRIAGPLFRFSRNMEKLIGKGPDELVPIRGRDQLQQEARQLEQSVERLRRHYREMETAADSALALISSGAEAESLAQAIAKLRDADSHVRL
ncbi:MAG: hypothetical protein AB1710_05175 [Pseudomonadota bacterium]